MQLSILSSRGRTRLRGYVWGRRVTTQSGVALPICASPLSRCTCRFRCPPCLGGLEQRLKVLGTGVSRDLDDEALPRVVSLNLLEDPGKVKVGCKSGWVGVGVRLGEGEGRAGGWARRQGLERRQGISGMGLVARRESAFGPGFDSGFATRVRELGLRVYGVGGGSGGGRTAARCHRGSC